MKWSDEKTAQLKTLASAGVSNPDIAKQLGIKVTDVYAKRSQLGITIDKVKAVKKPAQMQVNPVFEKAVKDMDTKVEVTREIDAKRKFIKRLESLLMEAHPSIKHISLMNTGNTVLIDFGQYGTNVNIEGDSLLAIIADVTRKCLF